VKGKPGSVKREGKEDGKMDVVEELVQMENELPRNAFEKGWKGKRTTWRRRLAGSKELNTFLLALQEMRNSIDAKYRIPETEDRRLWDTCASACLSRKDPSCPIQARVIRNLWEAVQYEVEMVLHLRAHRNGSIVRNALRMLKRNMEMAWGRGDLKVTHLPLKDSLGVSQRNLKLCLPLLRCFLHREKALVRARLGTLRMCSGRSRPGNDARTDSSEECTVVWDPGDSDCTQQILSNAGIHC